MITKKLINLCDAMSEFEGWKPDGDFEKLAKYPSVAYRNHNPGNLRYSIFELGTRDGFSFFQNDSVGFFAMCYDIMCKAKGNTTTTLTGGSTISDLIKIYSASEDEVLSNYIQHVCKKTGFDPFMQLHDLFN